MKIGVSSYCYASLMGRGSFTLFDAIEHAKKTGFQTIDFTDLKPPEGRNVNDFAREVKAACEKAGLEVCTYTIGANFIDKDLKEEIARVKGCIDTAKILGAPMLRHDIVWNLGPDSRFRTWRDIITYVEAGIREIAEYAAGKNIKTMSENHGFVLQQSARVETLVLAVNHPNYGILVDIGNFLCADEYGIKALPVVLPYAFHIHVKDFLYKNGTEQKPDDSWFFTKERNYLRGTILGHGVVNVAQCIEIIKQSGYNGCLTLEFEGPEEPLEAIRLGCEFMKKCIS